jgi:plasmid maintenance system antidote protein VapI
MSIRIGAAFGQSSDLWYLVQTDYDFWQASQAKRRKIAPLKQIRMAKAA